MIRYINEHKIRILSNKLMHIHYTIDDVIVVKFSDPKSVETMCNIASNKLTERYTEDNIPAFINQEG